ncbi:DUF7408 domain-containing protein [Candidatus Leptofilum sp.]|uniref:DUF7408 domain-containing protein n=1 Tax=Candidatus Leptofilum sp. TaxID=3241576 RepID=UPI003B5CA711
MVKQNASKIRFLLLFSLFFAIFAVLAVPAAAQDEDNGITLDVSVGFDSYYKSDYWIPVQVIAANSGAAVEGYVEILVRESGSQERTPYRSPISLPTQSNKRVILYIKAPAATGTLALALHQNDGTLVAEASSGSLSRLGATSDLLYGVVSPDAAEFAFLERIPGSRADAAVALLTLDDLPETAVAWSALDVLILNDTDTSQLTSQQRTALEVWLKNSGQLIVTGGANWQKTAASLTDLLPVTIDGSRSVDDLPGLRERIGIPFRDPGPYVVATSSLRNGELIFRQDELPLLARQSVGRGSVYFLALDPRLAPLLDWDGSEAIWAAIASRVPDLSSWGLGPQNSYAAAEAVTSLPALTLPSILQLIGFLLVYTVVVGPLNYWILKRRRQLERAWITIPTLVLIFSAVTYFTGFQLRGNDTIINQISVAYSQTDAEQADVYSLLGLYSPTRRTYDLVLPQNALARPFSQNFGAPFNNDEADIGAITYGNEVTISDVRVDIGDVSVFLAESAVPAVDVSGSATLTIEGNSLILALDVLNNSEITLETVSILVGNRALAVGEIGPSERTTLSLPMGTASSSGPTGGTGGIVFSGGFSSNAPLSANADTILGSFDYYNDRELYPRWQLLQALESSNFGGPGTFAVPQETAVLIAWSNEPQIGASLGDGAFNSESTTLYLIEIPLEQNLVSGRNISIPISLLNWEPMGNNNVYNPTIQDLYLNGGWVEFSYTPWPELQNMEVTSLGFSLTQQFEDPTQLPPDMQIWDFEQNTWQFIGTPVWGTNEIAEFAPYIGPNNEVRLRLEDTNSQFGLGIGEVYPILTGSLDG